MSDELAHVEDKERLTAASNVLNACASLSRDDRLLVLQLVWLLSAQRARSAALAVPGEFQREQARQLNQLEKMSVLVKKDTPDLELDRLLIATHAFEPFVVMVTSVILIVLFFVQHRGTGGLGSPSSFPC